MTAAIEIAVAALLIVGAGLALIGSLGLVKLPDFYMRLHGPTKATTLGIGCMLGASVLYMAFFADAVSFHEFLITVFLFITAPVSAHLVSKAALHTGVDDITGTAHEKAEEALSARGETPSEPQEKTDPLEETLDARVDNH